MNDEKKSLIYTSVLCTDAQSAQSEDGKIEFTCDPSETVLLELGARFGLNKDELEKSHPRAAEIPFDSDRKRMTTVNKLTENRVRVNVKGGLDEILSVCGGIVVHGETQPITPDDLKLIRAANETMANAALRVLAMAYKDLRRRRGRRKSGIWKRNSFLSVFWG